MKRLLVAFVLLVVSSFAIAAVNINTATKEQLDALPGIGPVKAQAIIDYRNANGPFKTPADIMKVKGIKDGEFAKIKDQIAVSGVTTAAAPAAPPKVEPAKTTPPATTPPATPAKEESKAKTSKADETSAAKAKAKEEKARKAADDKAAKEKAKTEKDGKAAKDKTTNEKASADVAKDKDKAPK
jgi:competence protein ComEA